MRFPHGNMATKDGDVAYVHWAAMHIGIDEPWLHSCQVKA